MNNIGQRIKSKTIHSFYGTLSKFFKTKGSVLMIHDVGGDDGQFNLSVASFNKLIEKLRGKNVVRLENWKEASDFYALSIDDVPEGFYHYAFPILKRSGIPFTIFVSVSLLDKPGFITTEQLLEMVSCNLCTVGSHGTSHTEFAAMDKFQANKDLIDAKNILESLIGRSIDLYAFPYGSYYACGYKNKHLVREHYRFGFSTVQIPFTVYPLLPDYFLPRINVSESNIDNILK